MAMTSAERQRKYRESRSDKRQLNTWISGLAFRALERASFHLGVTQKQFLEQLILEAEQKISDSIPTNKIDDYFMAGASDACRSLNESYKQFKTVTK